MKIAYKNKIPESFKQSFNAGNPCTVRKMTEDWNKENLESALKKKKKQTRGRTAELEIQFPIGEK